MPLSNFSPTDDDDDVGDGTLIFTGLGGRTAVPGPHLLPGPLPAVPFVRPSAAVVWRSFTKTKSTHFPLFTVRRSLGPRCGHSCRRGRVRES